MEIRIGVISHSQQFLNLMCTMVCDGVQIVTQNVNTLHAAEAAKNMAPNVDIIIARERTATIVQESTSVPVVNCDFEMIDFLSALSAQSLIGIGPIALIREASHINRSLLALDMINRLFGYQIELITFTDQNSLTESFKTAIAKGIRGIIGAGMAVEMAVNYGLRKVELVTTPDTAAAAFEKALLIAKSNQQRKNSEAYVTSVLNAMEPAYILADAENRVRYINEFAAEVTGLETGLAVTSISPPLVGEEQLKKLAGGQTLQDIPLHGKDPRRSFSCSLTPLFDQEKNYDGYLLQLKPVSALPAVGTKRTSLKGSFSPRYSFGNIVGGSDTMVRAGRLAAEYAKSDLNVLIYGETGTGKELFAQSIHQASYRSSEPFIALNCANLSPTLLESELFGYEDGAFTGAKRGGKKGFFEQAGSGTLFLDEIGEMPLDLQARLLRVLQSREIIRLGGNRQIAVDARVLAATNKDLLEAVRNGSFRSDLYYRLNTLCLTIPPLRERREDIPALTDFFFEDADCDPQIRRSAKRHFNKLLEEMTNYPWPGNVRELQGLVTRFIVEYSLIQEGIVKPSDLLPNLEEASAAEPSAANAAQPATIGTLQEMECNLIRTVGEHVGWNRKQMADTLGISQSTVWRKLKEYQLLPNIRQ